MQKRTLGAFCALLLIVAILAPVAPAAPPTPLDPTMVHVRDNVPHLMGRYQTALHERAMEAKLNGKASGQVHEVAHGQFVELARQGEDPIWTVCGEFNDYKHNAIPQPDRNVDNVTIWTSDFDRTYYETMLFSERKGAVSMRNYYIEQSSGRYAVYGEVTDWVTCPEDACDYDDGDLADGILHGPPVWAFLQDSIDGWYTAQLAAGKTAAEINDYLSEYDLWDRYDWDGDGNFNEPDGYIDHFQSVHAGEGQEAGGGTLGTCAIWSHSWYANPHLFGMAGPSPEFALGGCRIGDSDYWVGNYTIQPENGGVGVFAHEYAHDLGLPDLYAYAGDNSTGFWTLMSSGSWLSDGTQDIGSKPCHMGVWEKFQLGWLNYEVAYAGQKSTHKLGPAETNTKKAQALFVILPDKEVVNEIGDPYAGDYFYFSGAGNNLDNIMFRTVDLAAGAELEAKVNFDIEFHWDYAYLMASTDGGASWESVETNLSSTDDPVGQNLGYGITGATGGWVDLTADLSAYTGEVLLGFRYVTDVAVANPGFMVDDIVITDYPSDGAEDGGQDWTFYGFVATTGTETSYHFNAYVCAFRQHRGFDQSLATAYNFTNWTWVEHFGLPPGLLINYWDSSQVDNETPLHPGEGLLLPVDARPRILYHLDGVTPWQGRVQSYDAAFGLSAVPGFTLTSGGATQTFPRQGPVPVFDDRIQHWKAAAPAFGVKNPNTGTKIVVRSVSAKGSFMQVQVRPAR